eukprot:CAMPEP_0202357062 /NCGR_PEP_ID=MMETSP1126-20121109/11248_1 /ASSEMBLY_ACC=CAM_ASM_000457 /TAXON_ID=3047 /ORGANISM="Dunaliella tertiolecta, Strain CCMP1320" /LENGTH=187 /DNA_ID=CAMNT_0048949885 /DNA_START=40 /DNA_END=600 /DNA_ORIENTATION=-
MPSSELVSLLSSAVSKPGTVGTSGGVLALSVHCIMVRQGFNVVENPDVTGKRLRRSSYMPPLDWQAAGPNEWNFLYSLGGKCHHFKLVVALHEKTGRTFVHASEDGNPNNIQVLGLQLENYVSPDSSTLKTQDWNKVLVLDNEQKLNDLVITHIVNPLKENSEDLELPDPVHGDPAAYAFAGREEGW